MSAPLYLPSGRAVPVANVIDGRLVIESTDDARDIAATICRVGGPLPPTVTRSGLPHYVRSVDRRPGETWWRVELEAVALPPQPVRP